MPRRFFRSSPRTLLWVVAALAASFSALPGWGSDLRGGEAPSVGEPPLGFYTVSPHRIVDTRSDPPGLVPGVPRKMFASRAGVIPATAKAAVLNISAIAPNYDGHLSVYFGDTVPNTVALNYSAGRTRTAIVIVGLDPSGQFTLLTTQPGGPALLQVTVDAIGYFE